MTLVLLLALLPVVLGVCNLLLLRRPGVPPGGAMPDGTLVSILVPARDEAGQIASCVRAALESRGVPVEVVVMDDGSVDHTAMIVEEIAAGDPRVRLERAPPLPPDWTGKVHACWRLAEAARGTHLLFIDADVRLHPDAAARLAGHAAKHDIALVSAVPHQHIVTVGEGLTVPMIGFLLFGYLPGAGRAFTRQESMAAGCGQLLLCERDAYFDAGGHAELRDTLHDGLRLARHMREGGWQTEMVDGTVLAECRMYRGFGEAWAGFLKNAHEGMATPRGLPVWTVLLAGGQLLPWLFLGEPGGLTAVLLTLALRAAITWRVREPWWTVPLHPAAVAVALAIQWVAFGRALLGRPAAWKGRAYPATGTLD